MNLRQLEHLLAVAETGSFSACGRKLHVSQSAISRQILLLEEELGEPLFLRVGRQVRMTPAAESLVSQIASGVGDVALDGVVEVVFEFVGEALSSIF